MDPITPPILHLPFGLEGKLLARQKERKTLPNRLPPLPNPPHSIARTCPATVTASFRKQERAILFRNSPSSATESPPVTCLPTSLQPMLLGGQAQKRPARCFHRLPSPPHGAEDVDTWKLFAAPCRLPAAIRESRGRKPANLRNRPVHGVSAPGFWGILLRTRFL